MTGQLADYRPAGMVQELVVRVWAFPWIGLLSRPLGPPVLNFRVTFSSYLAGSLDLGHFLLPGRALVVPGFVLPGASPGAHVRRSLWEILGSSDLRSSRILLLPCTLFLCGHICDI